MIKQILKRIRDKARPLLLQAAGEDAAALARYRQWGKPCFEGDGMRCYYKDVSWMKEPNFLEAYK